MAAPELPVQLRRRADSGWAGSWRSYPRQLRSFSTAGAAAQHVGLVGRLASQLGTEAVQPAEADLVRWGKELDTWEFRHLTQRLRHCPDPDGALADGNALQGGLAGEPGRAVAGASSLRPETGPGPESRAYHSHSFAP
ncbi:MAG: hypothetical protein JF888_11175 [Candidatus Dormibacteraeota bacterium]|uniref:Uncharacterized protein n=1 Tax=Candidatus Dormiibacter inghamiae TaxID=3127013 RepID=A0A934KHN6_9BACT|nr:hypothetical protein [Candidatus Dormibacteraeota bacterium]MBJ7607241.1 hypothetical protein [Candidatus Dormibacteraeota bacterium]